MNSITHVRTRAAAVATASLVLALLMASPAWAAPKLTLSPSSGPPTATTKVGGSGFKASHAIDVYFDTSWLAEAVSNGSGAFSGIPLKVPGTAEPGVHWVTAKDPATGQAAQTTFTVSTDWPQFRNTPRHKALNAYENVLRASNVAGLDMDWTWPTGGRVDSSPAVVNGIVYVGSNDGKLYALDGASGALVWAATTGGVVESSPSVSNGIVYVGSDDGRMHAYDAATGVIRWTSGVLGAPLVSSPAVVNTNRSGKLVIVGSFSAKVYGLAADTGAVVWSTTVDNAVHSSPAVFNGIAYVATLSGMLYAIGADQGNVMWSKGIGMARSSPVVANGVVYAMSVFDDITALNASTGAPLWAQDLGAGPAGFGLTSSPAVAKGVVYVGADLDVVALQAATGATVWRTTVSGGDVISSPAVANGVVYVGSDGGKVHALDAVSGALLWSAATGDAVESSPAVANGTVYVGSGDHQLYAFDLSSGQRAERPDPSRLHRPAAASPVGG